MGCVLISLAVMLILLLFAMRMNTHVINTLGDVYQSNTELNDFSQALAETEKSMETYIVYHTFESIDSFYTARTKMEKFMDKAILGVFLLILTQVSIWLLSLNSFIVIIKA